MKNTKPIAYDNHCLCSVREFNSNNMVASNLWPRFKHNLVTNSIKDAKKFIWTQYLPLAWQELEQWPEMSET